MITRSSVVVGAGGRLRTLRCAPPLTVRRVVADDPHECALCLVGSAAGPLPGDDLELRIELEDGARARLTAAGASIAQGRDGGRARVHLDATLHAGARLVADPGPLIACEGSRVDVSLAITLAGDATIEWYELIVLGRTAEPHPGAVTLSWDVTRDGRPVLRQYLDLTDSTLAVTGGHRVLASTLVSGPDIAARTVVVSPTAVAHRVDEHTSLLTVLGANAAEVTAMTCRLRAEHDAVTATTR